MPHSLSYFHYNDTENLILKLLHLCAKLPFQSTIFEFLSHSFNRYYECANTQLMTNVKVLLNLICTCLWHYYHTIPFFWVITVRNVLLKDLFINSILDHLNFSLHNCHLKTIFFTYVSRELQSVYLCAWLSHTSL